jgi:hypothetical protein
LSTGIPGPPMFRPQRFARSRRFAPPRTLRACFIALPCPGFSLQGFCPTFQPHHLVGDRIPSRRWRRRLPVARLQRTSRRPQGVAPVRGPRCATGGLGPRASRSPPAFSAPSGVGAWILEAPSRLLRSQPSRHGTACPPHRWLSAYRRSPSCCLCPQRPVLSELSDLRVGCPSPEVHRCRRAAFAFRRRESLLAVGMPHVVRVQPRETRATRARAVVVTDDSDVDKLRSACVAISSTCGETRSTARSVVTSDRGVRERSGAVSLAADHAHRSASPARNAGGTCTEVGLGGTEA